MGCEAAVGLLLDHGADPNKRDLSGGDQPLRLKIKHGHSAITALLLGKGATVDTVGFNCQGTLKRL